MENFNCGWEFMLENESDWKAVELPHDWLISDVRNLYKNGVGLYRKRFKLDETLSSDERLFLHFDGVYQDSALYVNGNLAGEWKNGYTAFSHEITPFLSPNENEILLKVNYESPNTRWYSGAGIYRDCFLIRKNATHFKHNGIYLSTRKQSDSLWHIEIDAEITSPHPKPDLQFSLQKIKFFEEGSLGGETFFQKSFSPQGLILSIENPQLWDISNPICYELKCELIINNVVVDTAYVRFGFREIKFTSEGFFLNGRRVQLNGVCHHHDLGALGSAVSKDAIRRQLMIYRDMGVNAIRTAHNPPAAVFMELCDEMGFLVMSEFTDVWKRAKTKFDYARFFEEWAVRDVESWVKRDRNCPSLIMWSVGNEVYDTHADYEDGSATLRFLMEETRKHDPKNNAEITLCSNYMPWENTQKCADIVKLMGYNYADYLYAEHRAKHPDWIIYGSETAATVQSRGVYHFPLAKALLADDDLQCSALGNSATSWGAKSTEAVIAAHADNMGQFIWSGFDYIGEPTPYHTKNCYFGHIDTAGFAKDSYYIYKSAWAKNKAAHAAFFRRTKCDAPPKAAERKRALPAVARGIGGVAPIGDGNCASSFLAYNNVVLHLYPYWDWSDGQPIDVRIASNAPKTELYLNGKLLGSGADFIVPYESGTLKAVAYDENGEVLAECERKSFGDAAELIVKTEKIGELIFAEISARDVNGNLVENANNRVKISVKNGELLGLDNGDSTDYDQYQGTNNRRLFGGKLLAIVKDSKNAEITVEFDNTDIPIRKIELIRQKFEITAKIHPENATCNDLHWRLSDSAGIDSPLGRLVDSDGVQTLHPKGDGEVYVRAATKNGKEHISLISVLPLTISGYGKPFLDPYSFISGGLYNAGNDTVTNGNERGVATARDVESIVGFTDLDFGTFGADEITLWLFPLGGDPFEFEIWRGLPEDGELLLTPLYDKGSIWNTYQTVTYKLPEKLRGIQTLSLVFRQKVHIKGFQFKCKTFEKIPFAACNKIYGDSYNVTETAIEKIGNNVTISFANMNFDKPTAEIELSWRSHLPQNTIQLKFDGEDGECSSMLTLPASPEKYSQATLKLDNPLNGKGQVNFIFLPGSEIDLEYLKFVG